MCVINLVYYKHIYTKLYRYDTLPPLHNNQMYPMEGIICLLKYNSITDKDANVFHVSQAYAFNMGVLPLLEKSLNTHL